MFALAEIHLDGDAVESGYNGHIFFLSLQIRSCACNVILSRPEWSRRMAKNLYLPIQDAKRSLCSEWRAQVLQE